MVQLSSCSPVETTIFEVVHVKYSKNEREIWFLGSIIFQHRKMLHALYKNRFRKLKHYFQNPLKRTNTTNNKKAQHRSWHMAKCNNLYHLKWNINTWDTAIPLHGRHFVRTHARRHTHTDTHDDSIRQNAMHCILPKNKYKPGRPEDSMTTSYEVFKESERDISRVPSYISTYT